jgi:uncharacterized membrane protein YphA (DoxX/SURF4 family)
MNTLTASRLFQRLRRALTAPWVRWLALLGICSAYLQGGLIKTFNFSGALAEMNHFGLVPAGPFAVATIVVELGAALMILTGWHRWLGALILAAFTLGATFVANRFWEIPAPDRSMVMNAFFEHFGLIGAFLLTAWHDLRAAVPTSRDREGS